MNAVPRALAPIVIHSVEVQPIVYRDQRVLTFAQIDKIHGRSEGTAKRNFTENKARLIEGEDFYLVKFSKKDEFRTFGIQIPTRGLIVVTESGYLLLVKSFTDDLAWQVQKELVKVYFRYQALAEPLAPTEQPVVLDRINAEQARHLGHIVYLIKRSFVMEGSAAHASYALLRKRFGLETGIGSLPTIYYDQAIQILTELEKLAFAWKGIKIGVESKLIRNALRLGKPSDLSLYESMLTSEIEQLHQDHAHSLKLLAP